MERPLERNAFRAVVASAACVPVFGGLAGVLLGPCVFDAGGCGELDPFFRSHTIYLSGLLLAMGLAFWRTLHAPETEGATYRLLTTIVVIGGLARLYSVVAEETASPAIWLALVMELAVTPSICLWQARIARLADSPQPPR